MKDCWATKDSFERPRYTSGYRKGTACASKMDAQHNSPALHRALKEAHKRAYEHHSARISAIEKEHQARTGKLAPLTGERAAHGYAANAHEEATYRHARAETDPRRSAEAHRATATAVETSRESGDMGGWDESKHPRDENGKFT